VIITALSSSVFNIEINSYEKDLDLKSSYKLFMLDTKCQTTKLVKRSIRLNLEKNTSPFCEMYNLVRMNDTIKMLQSNANLKK